MKTEDVAVWILAGGWLGLAAVAAFQGEGPLRWIVAILCLQHAGEYLATWEINDGATPQDQPRDADEEGPQDR